MLMDPNEANCMGRAGPLYLEHFPLERTMAMRSIHQIYSVAGILMGIAALLLTTAGAQGPVQSMVELVPVTHSDGLAPDKFTYDLRVQAPSGNVWVSATMTATVEQASFVQDSGGAANHGPPNPGQQSSSAKYDSFWTIPSSFPSTTSNAEPSFVGPLTVLAQTLSATWVQPGASPPNPMELRTIARISFQPFPNLPTWCLTVNGQVTSTGTMGNETTPFSLTECFREAGIPRKPLLSEATSSADSRGFEITNFTLNPFNMAGWRLRYRDGSGTYDSTPFGQLTLPTGGRLIVQEPGTISGIDPNIPVIVAFGPIAASNSAFTVTLLDENDLEVDELRVATAAGFHPGWSFGGTFRGAAYRTAISGSAPAPSVERIWGLDTDSGADWTEQPAHSFGLENQGNGFRGIDPVVVRRLLISEVDDFPDYVEIYNADTVPVDLKGVFILCSAGQGSTIVTVRPFPNSSVLAPGAYAVIGESQALPPEMPLGTLFVQAGINIPFTTPCYEIGLYDALGRVLDVMRTTGHDDVQVHNHPRVPSAWDDFTGAAGRTDGLGQGDASVARLSPGVDSNRGSDWRGSYTRTMGLPNGNFSALPGLGDVYDVRLNEGVGDGLEVVLNAGGSAAGMTYSFAFSVGHANGIGPFLGLGFDALFNFLNFYGVPPWTGTLDALGGARFGLPSGSLPPGVDLDCVFLLQDPSGLLVARTYVLSFDT